MVTRLVERGKTKYGGGIQTLPLESTTSAWGRSRRSAAEAKQEAPLCFPARRLWHSLPHASFHQATLLAPSITRVTICYPRPRRSLYNFFRTSNLSIGDVASSR